MLILIFGIPCLLILFVFLQPSTDVHINLSHVSYKPHVVIIETFRRIYYLLNWLFQFFSDMIYFWWRTICLSVIINFKLIFYKSIVRYSMWYICSSSTKIIIYYHIVCSLSRTKYLANSILNIHGIIKIEDGFKIMFSPHRYFNTKYINIWFNTKLKVETVLFTCNFVIFYFYFHWQHFIICTEEKSHSKRCLNLNQWKRHQW